MRAESRVVQLPKSCTQALALPLLAIAATGFGVDTTYGQQTTRDCPDGRGYDYYDGGAGTDTITFSCTTHPIFVDLDNSRAHGADIGTDVIVGYEIVRAGFGNDLLLGSTRAETLDGAGGDDRLMGRGGSDILIGGVGADMFLFANRVDENDIDVIVDFDLAHDIIGILGVEHPGVSYPFDATQLAVAPTAVTSATRIIYDPTDGSVRYDPDGVGPEPAEHFVTLLARPLTLAVAQFEVVLEIVVPN
jgi:serralysin